MLHTGAITQGGKNARDKADGGGCAWKQLARCCPNLGLAIAAATTHIPTFANATFVLLKTLKVPKAGSRPGLALHKMPSSRNREKVD
jgi:hypothetical protein